ncbi:hypothetical protein QCA50_015234 [Cerrena zonata]|uniref:CxC2-like cysteine cluster KDZ transposase-associated domain-containing protein n=1 Tax=Cerrena zonata TaxID=2478898 RepID=A0AAW0FMV7_9APHY
MTRNHHLSQPSHSRPHNVATTTVPETPSQPVAPLTQSQHDTTRLFRFGQPHEDVYFEFEWAPPRRQKTQNSYIEEWLSERNSYLKAILDREAPPSRLCSRDCGQAMKWRCHDCFGEPVFCTDCCRTTHLSNPFHRVSVWSDTFFYRSSLRHAGVVLHLGHNGFPCPSTPAVQITSNPVVTLTVPESPIHNRDLDQHTRDPNCATLDTPSLATLTLTDDPPSHSSDHVASPQLGAEDLVTGTNVTDPGRSGDHIDPDSSDDLMEFERAGISHPASSYPKGRDARGNQWLTVVDIGGVHHLPTHFCSCSSSELVPPRLQLLQLGLYPATINEPQTVFTFRLLDDFDVDNLETKAAAQRYYAKLKRLTSNAFPQDVADRYREFMRVMREWRNLKSRQRMGIGHDTHQDAIPDGGLALFCPACPQPGINLPENWQDDGDQLKYMPTLVVDGNFKQEHLKMKQSKDDVPLSDGHGYMVGKERFDQYIKSVPKTAVEPSTCHEHDAVKSQNSTRAHLDATGIGAVACKHGCFYPHSVVNFQKGEGQRYMDYAIVNALNYISVVAVALLLYDIMCQFFLKFASRIADCPPFLNLRSNLAIKPGIGLFHVHGHVKECYARYAPTFIRGAGMVDGEIMETLWSPLNHTAPSARPMSWFHRQEYLDSHMGDSNWKKLTRMVPTLFRKWQVCLEQVADSQDYFDKLSQHVGASNAADWTRLENRIQLLRSSNIEVMDALDVKEAVAPGKADVQRELATEEDGTSLSPGTSAWISFGLKIEEQQIDLLKQVRKLQAEPSIELQLSLQAKRRRLQHKIDKFIKESSHYLLGIESTPTATIGEDWFEEDDDDDYNVELSTSDIALDDSCFPEQVSLPLPSSFGSERCKGLLQSLARCELKLREGQAHDALHNLRIAIAHKSFIYRSRIRKNAPNTGYSKRLRSYGDAHAVQMSIDHAAKVYSTARRAIEVIDKHSPVLTKLQVLTREDLIASTAVSDPNARGQRQVSLSWIWQTVVNNGTPAFVTEMMRVNWLRAKSRRDRWAEEKVLIHSELEWTHRYFLRNVDLWRGRAVDKTPGQTCYALKQAETWRRFAHHANLALDKVNMPQL